MQNELSAAGWVVIQRELVVALVGAQDATRLVQDTEDVVSGLRRGR